MAVKVEDMVAELRLTLDKFSPQLMKAEKEAKKSSRKMSNAFKAVALSVTGLTSKLFSFKTALTGLGVFIGARFVKNTLNMADSIDKVAAAAGITTRQLQRYRFAAEQSGVETQTMDQALIEVGVRIGELKLGTGSLTGFLNLYDKSLIKVIQNTKTKEEALNVLFKALEKVKGGAQQAAFANAVFGGGALKVVNIINSGKDAFKRYGEEAERAGFIISNKFIKDSANLNDKLNILNKILTVIKTKIVEALLPVLTDLAVKFIKNKTAVDKLAKGLATIATGIANLIAFIGANPLIGSIGIVGWLVLGKVGKFLLIGTIVLLNRIKKIITDMNQIDPIQNRKLNENEKRLILIRTALEKNVAALRKERVEVNANWMLNKISEKSFQAGNTRILGSLNARLKGLQAIKEELKFVTAQADLNARAGLQGIEGGKPDATPLGNTGSKGKVVSAPSEIDPEQQAQLTQQIALNEMMLMEEAAQQERVIAIVSQGVDRRNQIERDSAAKRFAFEQSTNRKKVSMVLGTLTQITQGSQRSSKKLFQLNKIAGTASATIDAFKGAGKTLGQYPYPIGPILAGVHLATGLANARNISKQSFTGSAGGGSITGGGSVPSIAATPNITQSTPGSVGNGGAQTRIEILIKGSVFNAEVLDEMIEGINERVGNNVELVATKVAA